MKTNARKNRYDLTGQRFGKLTVIERCEDYVFCSGRKRPQWLCLCDCGNYKKVPAHYLRNGHTTSCGCNRIKDISGERFGRPVVLSMDGYATQPNGQVRTQWLCQCDCGQKTVVSHGNLTSGHTTSCGCLRCSAQESVIEHILTDKRIPHQREYVFDDFRSKTTNNHFRFDFALFDDRDNLLALIEYQGSQHFIEYPGFESYGAGQRYASDGFKVDYCKKHGIKLFTIIYLEDTQTKLNEILSIVYGNTVPSADDSAKV